ncbi:hypothetical protein IWQ62_004877 [Dispira parvispora]|uniref:EF-hand domain-containing protein n=1 Tax=Dispira parvispora TaxID=1520584 RepID=A0A9W8ANX7_9FUNG|nr:hypothetical protein IWQ62_004877 [Dispira parvispora]
MANASAISLSYLCEAIGINSLDPITPTILMDKFQISLEEAHKFFNKMEGPNSQKTTQKVLEKYVYSDKNHTFMNSVFNGFQGKVISENEFVNRWASSAGPIEMDMLKILFDECDKKLDGHITREEFLTIGVNSDDSIEV